ncbi:PREDICTED: adipocyte plasma membrane-associated protein-like [Polistes dominula]|uniref:Adipocyte plasma membrane-associated protein-like n=1 Tax=Polistes dominula TaxID=743375 RepID=A0ABM1ID97_POLDO|nr:PREDICTED: adipocyte plasma membrane-associated protein-like [Polistes dominula]
MGYLKKTGTVFIYVALFLAIITFLPGLPPDVTFSEYSIKPSTKLSGKLDINNRLNGAELLHVDKLKGPEAFDSYNGELYTGLEGGYVVKINENKMETFVEFGGKCDEILKYHECGKILGLKFDKKGNLYVVDTYKGIFKVDPKGYYQKIVDISKPINNKVPQIPNNLDIAENGDIYWTDSSTDFPLYDAIYTTLVNPSGRLIRYNAATKTNEVLMENLAFANGVKLSKDESFLLVVESLSSRINKYYLKGPKAGQHEILHEGLPGILDNIHEDNNGGFFVSIYSYIDEENPNLVHTLMPHPNIRKMIVRLLTIIEYPFKWIQNAYPNFFAERIVHAIGSLETFSFLFPPKSIVLNFDATGKLVDAAYATDERIKMISSAFVHNGYLWLGSPHSKYVARVPLKQAFPHLAQMEKVVHRSSQQDTKEIPKAHSTTIKPPKPVETPTVKTTAKPVTKTAENMETGKSPQASTQQPKATTLKPSTTAPPPTTTTVKPSTTAVPTTTVKPTTQTAAPTTTVKPTTTTTAAPTTTVKPSTTAVPTTTVKPSTQTAAPTTTTTTTTVKPSTASQTTSTPKVTTTKPVVKQNVETGAKPNNQEIKSETVKPVATKPNIQVDSTKQNVQVNKVVSDVKSEAVKETKPEVNKQTVQNTQTEAQKQQVQTPELRNNESPKTINNNNNNNINNNIPK